MGKLSDRYFPEPGEYEDWENMGQEQSDEEELVGPMAVAVPVLGEMVAVLLFIACAFLWCGIASGRI